MKAGMCCLIEMKYTQQEILRMFLIALITIAAVSFTCCAETDTENKGNNLDLLKPYTDLFRKRCPLCDSSVYSYCGDKLFHDSCCCIDPLYEPLPYQCRYADCSFLHANTCREHSLITACCCTSL